jgi:hypothetical protein
MYPKGCVQNNFGKLVFGMSGLGVRIHERQSLDVGVSFNYAPEERYASRQGREGPQSSTFFGLPVEVTKGELLSGKGMKV